MKTIDDVEHNVASFHDGVNILRRQYPDRYQWMTDKMGDFIQRSGSDYREPAQQAFKTVVMCLARITLRYGVLAEKPRHYHNEQHTFDLFSRLLQVYDHVGDDYFSPSERLTLVMFTAAHDLRQVGNGYDEYGVGTSERASVDELWRVMEIAGYGYHYDSEQFDILRAMIYGTTFYQQPFNYKGQDYPGGALAQAMAAKWRSQYEDWDSNPQVKRQTQLVLLAADLDTANVAEPLTQYAERTVALCRELQNLRGHATLDAQTATAVYQFLTTEQQRYFFELQRFYSEPAQGCFGAAKQRNGDLLRQLIEQLENDYGPQPDTTTGEVTGEAIAQRFIELAQTLTE